MIRRATAADHGWMTELAALVYEDLGDYGKIIPSWLVHPGVLAYIEDQNDSQAGVRGVRGALGARGVPGVSGVRPLLGGRCGFILLGFYEPQNEGRTVADLLAIAVEPAHQRRGIGRRLLRYSVELATLIGANNGVGEIRLTVADTNRGGRALFASAGFEVLNDDHGSYDGGQRAIRMTRPLEVAAARARRSG